LEPRTLLSAGTLDLSFGDGGKVFTDFSGSHFDNAAAVALQDDGKILAVGTTEAGDGRQNFALARYLPSGTLDTSFSSDGRVITDLGGGVDRAFAVAVQADGKIVVAGDAAGDFGLARYQPDGSLDTSFGSGGRVVTDFDRFDVASAVVIQPDGKIVAAGSTGELLALARYNPDGTLDTSFSFDGKLATNFEGDGDFARAVVIQSDGKIIAVGGSGGNVALARYSSDGSLDPGFGADGMVVTDVRSDSSFNVFASDAVIQSDGRIVVASATGDHANSDFVLLRYRTDGSLDPDFDADGKVFTDLDGRVDFAFSLVIQPDGKIIAGGGAGPDFALARYHPDGTLDTSFGSGGRVVTPCPSAPPYDLALQGDGKIVMLATAVGDAPRRDFVLLRYNNDIAGVVFDPGQQVVTITGTPFDDGLELSADQLGRMIIRHNGRPLDPIDVSNGLKSVIVHLGAGDDFFAVLGDQLQGIVIAVAGQEGADMLSVKVEPPPPAPGPNQPPQVEPPPPLEVSFDGERLLVIGTDRADDIRVVARPDQHPTPCFDVGISDPASRRLLAQITADNVGHFSLDAAAGIDRISALLESAGLIAVPIVVDLGGGADDDHIFIDMQNNVSSFAWSVLADGGAGDDFLQTRGLTGAILLGGKGIDEVTGGDGRDVLVGGEDGDSVIGGKGQDIIIPGMTAFDANPDALRWIHTFWNGQLPFLERVEYLSGPSDAPFHLITGESVFEDGADNSASDHSLDDWLLAPCFVTNTNDSGPGSLREAIECANMAAVPALAAVSFRIPTTDPNFVDVDSHLPGGDPDPDAFVIAPVSELPPLDNVFGFGINLDGSTQTSFGGDTNPFGPEIVLVNEGGITEPPVASGLRLFSDDNRVFGLNIQGFAEDGIQIESSRNWVAGNYIGTDATGRAPRGNSVGVAIGGGLPISADDNRIGTDGDGINDEAERNVISANASYGVSLFGDGTDHNVVAGNYIGTDATGRSGLGNLHAVAIHSGASFNRIGTDGNGVGDTAERNVIAASLSHGLFILNAGTDGNVVAGNLIGTDATGSAPLGNLTGVLIFGGAGANRIGTDGDAQGDEAERNVISANRSSGVRIFDEGTDENVVAGNYIGVDVTGSNPLRNGQHGVSISGGAKFNRIGTNDDVIADDAERNIISANGQNGVHIRDVGTEENIVAGNYIGLDATGSARLGNVGHGVAIIGGAKSNLIGLVHGPSTGSEGNIISANGLNGVHIEGAGTDGNIVALNRIGTDRTGSRALGNGVDGVRIIELAAGNFIGFGAGSNLISGNGNEGVRIQNGASGNQVLRNLIGTDISGTRPLGNASDGVAIVEAPDNIIGGSRDGAGNVISANTLNGVALQGSASTGNVVRGNFIGTDWRGTMPLGNGGYGVSVNVASNNVIGDARPGFGNIISANRAGVFIGSEVLAGESVGNHVRGNFIGLDITGAAPLPNGTNGVEIVNRARQNVVGTDADGVNDDGEGNVISANSGDGVLIRDAHGNSVAGNHIGTDVSGLKGLGNGRRGVFIQRGADNLVGGTNPAAKNVISDNADDGVQIQGPGTRGNRIQGNFVGTDAKGTAALPNRENGVTVVEAADNLIGGSAAGAGNLISGNAFSGLVLFRGAVGNLAQGNRIGTDVTGGIALANGASGVLIREAQANIVGSDGNGVADAVEGNLISGNRSDGVTVQNADNNIVAGNSITMNVGHGVHIFAGAEANRIGTDGVSVAADWVEGNLITGNMLDGVRVVGIDSVRNTIRGNSIHSNSLLGIDLGGDGVTDNDPRRDGDTGPNQFQNYPKLSSARAEGSGTRVRGTLQSLPQTSFTIDFYANAVAHPSGHGEGQRWLGAITLTTNAGGTANFNHLLDVSAQPGEFITATATEGLAANLGNTSEFSATRLVKGRGDRDPDPEVASAPAENTRSATSGDAPGMIRIDRLGMQPQAVDYLFGRDHQADGSFADTSSFGTRRVLGSDPNAFAPAADAILALLAADEGPAWIDSKPFPRGRVRFA
jgi:titin